MKQQHSTALITGASSGIGLQLAKIHAARGGDLILVARNELALKAIKAELEAEHPIEVQVIALDLSLSDSAHSLYQKVQQLDIQVDILINNAGFGGIGAFHQRAMRSDIDMINLNVTTLTALTRLFLPDFVAAGRGRILNVSSTASLMPGPMQAVYYATKAYVTSFSNAIAEELKGSGVTVTALLPGATETQFGAVSGMDKTSLFAKTASAYEVARSGYDAMMKGKLNQVAGIQWSQRLMFWLLPLIPKKWMLRAIKQMQTV